MNFRSERRLSLTDPSSDLNGSSSMRLFHLLINSIGFSISILARYIMEILLIIDLIIGSKELLPRTIKASSLTLALSNTTVCFSPFRKKKVTGIPSISSIIFGMFREALVSIIRLTCSVSDIIRSKRMFIERLPLADSIPVDCTSNVIKAFSQPYEYFLELSTISRKVITCSISSL